MAEGHAEETQKRGREITVRHGKTSQNRGTQAESWKINRNCPERKGRAFPTQDCQSLPGVLMFLVPMGTDNTTVYNYKYVKPSKILP